MRVGGGEDRVFFISWAAKCQDFARILLTTLALARSQPYLIDGVKCFREARALINIDYFDAPRAFRAAQVGRTSSYQTP